MALVTAPEADATPEPIPFATFHVFFMTELEYVVLSYVVEDSDPIEVGTDPLSYGE